MDRSSTHRADSQNAEESSAEKTEKTQNAEHAEHSENVGCASAHQPSSHPHSFPRSEYDPQKTQTPDLTERCTTDKQLQNWISAYTDLTIPTESVCPHHDAPFAYIKHAYFEPTSDVVVWAPRGGGKTRLGALATLLDLLHKPNCQVRILGGSLEQSLKMWDHLHPHLLDIASHLLAGRQTYKHLSLINGASARVLTQSQRAVRGLRVQKLRCDEVELFTPEIWQAAQLTTRSLKPKNAAGAQAPIDVAGVIEAISTLHTPHGLMHRILEQARAANTKTIRWCLLEVLERCPPERTCHTCPLWEDCGGVAKKKCNGFLSIEDAIAMKKRVSKETWESEMLCKRPVTNDAVFPNFKPEIHVREDHPHEQSESHPSVPSCLRASVPCLTLSLDFGYAAPFVCLWIAKLATRDSQLAAHVIDEYVQPQRTLEDHLQHIKTRPWKNITQVTCDPAGSARNDQTSASNITMLKSAGYIVRHRRSLIVEGLEMIRAHLAPASGPPRLFIHPRCKRLIHAMEAYRYAKGGSELPIKDGTHDHLIDALRYFFVNQQTQSSKATGRPY